MEGEGEEEWAHRGSMGLGLFAVGPPELGEAVFTSTSPGPPAGRELCTLPGTRHVGKHREGRTQTQTGRHGGR